MRICIVGGGTYGCYLAKVISESLPFARVTILEVGSEETRSEHDMGFRSCTHGTPYSALSQGRYFGLGGSSARWGGQLLTFSHNDFANPSRFLRDIVNLNERHRTRVLRRLGVEHTSTEHRVSAEMFVKKGVWLSYGRRNLYRSLGVKSLSNVEVRVGCRVTRLFHKQRAITGVQILEAGRERREEFDHYFLTSGAFESNRLLAISGLSDETFAFSDHLSQRAFRIRGSTKIGAVDFRFRFRGTSLITKRLVGEVDGVSFFAHPIFNSNFAFFQTLKEVLYHRKVSRGRVFSLLINLPQATAFFFNMFVLRQLYIHKSEWYLQLDLENFADSGHAIVSKDLDRQGQSAVEVELTVNQKTDSLFEKARELVRQHLQEQCIPFEELVPETESVKYEDTYHPFGMYGSDSTSVDEFFSRFGNLLVANTGILPRAGGINCTAAVFPLLEEYIENRLMPQARNDGRPLAP